MYKRGQIAGRDLALGGIPAYDVPSATFQRLNMDCDVFISYAHEDNIWDRNNISHLVTQLRAALGVLSRDRVQFFIDQNIKWGDVWQESVDKSLAGSKFMIAFLSPSYFKSTNCHNEWMTFRDLERQLSCNNLILPIYYRLDREFDAYIKGELLDVIPLIEDLAARQYIDWRDFRDMDSKGKRLKMEIEAMAVKIADRIGEISPAFSANRSTEKAEQPSHGEIESVDPTLETEFVLRFNGLTSTQKCVLRLIYERPHNGEISIDKLGEMLRGVEEVSSMSGDELYYRAKDLSNQGFIDFRSTGLKQTSIVILQAVQFVMHKNKLLKT